MFIGIGFSITGARRTSLPANRFTLALDPTSLELEPETPGEVAVTLTLVAGVAEDAVLSVPNLPSGWTAEWDDDTVTTDGGTAMLTITPAFGADGSYSLAIRAAAPSQTKNRIATLTITDGDELMFQPPEDLMFQPGGDLMFA